MRTKAAAGYTTPPSPDHLCRSSQNSTGRIVSPRVVIVSQDSVGKTWRGTVARTLKSAEGAAVSEMWFHNLNSQNKFSHNRQNKIFKLFTRCFPFQMAEQIMEHLVTCQCLALSAQFLRPQSPCRQNIAFACAIA